MRYMVDIDKPSLEELELAHFGVKGMKWGVIREKLAESSAARQKNRALNKEFKKAETKKRDDEIEAARERYHSTARKNYLDAKAQYKIDKKEIGTAAARAKFDKVKQKNIDDAEVANMTKSGKETAIAVLAVAGLVALRVGLAVAGSRR
jgi:hypothetical protein